MTNTESNPQEEKMRNILIVEDDAFMRNLLVNKLKKERFHVDQAASGEEAMEKVAEKIPDLILLDLILPQMDGFEVIQKLKTNPKTSYIPILILSNLGEKQDLEKAKTFGVEGFMIKANFTPSEIITQIHKLLSKRYL